VHSPSKYSESSKTFMYVPAGAYMNSLDESDLQFYATYVQPVVIAEDSVQAGLAQSSLTIIPAEIPHRTLQLPFIIIPIAIPVFSRSQNHIPWLVLWATSQLQVSTSTQALSVTQNTSVSAAARHSGENALEHDSGSMQEARLSCGSC